MDRLMDITGIAVFATALFLAAASPGPGIAAIVARVLGRGTSGAFAFTAGVAIGDVVWLTLAIAGLAVLANTFYGLFLVIKWAGVAYLLYLAWAMWHAPAGARDIEANTQRERPMTLFLAGLMVTMGNPKVMVFYLALLPTILDLAAVTLLGYAELVGVTLMVLALVFGAYILLAARARVLLTSPHALRRVQRGSAAMMAGAAVWIAAR
jgi:threonine/homoserine/homoserine lactone efflux protein